MKRSGFKKLTYEEALAKKKAKDAKRSKTPLRASMTRKVGYQSLF